MSSSYPSQSSSTLCKGCPNKNEMEDPQKGKCEHCIFASKYPVPARYSEAEGGKSSAQEDPSHNTSSVYSDGQSSKGAYSTGQAQDPTHHTSSLSHHKRQEPSRDQSDREASDSNKRGKISGQYNTVAQNYNAPAPLGYGSTSTQIGTDDVSTLERRMATTTISGPSLTVFGAPAEIIAQPTGYEGAGGTSSHEQQHMVTLTQANRPPPVNYLNATLFPDAGVLEPFLQFHAQKTGDYTPGTESPSGAQDFIISTAEGEIVDLSLCTWMNSDLERCRNELGGKTYCDTTTNRIRHAERTNSISIFKRRNLIREIKRIRIHHDYIQQHQLDQ